MKFKNCILALISIFVFSAAYSQDSPAKRAKNRTHKSDTSWSKSNDTMRNNRSRRNNTDTSRMTMKGMNNAARKHHNMAGDSTKK
ncbi:MAG: hypothetical protein M3R50_02630 [Bacteroidota bacterium]|nr:hypothetical protein [Bacteroidota bacterium]